MLRKIWFPTKLVTLKRNEALCIGKTKYLRGFLKIVQCSPISGSGHKRITDLEDFPLRQVHLLGTPLIQRSLTSVLIGQTLRSHCHCGPKGHTYCSNWHQILSLFTWYWICRPAEWKLWYHGSFHLGFKESLQGFVPILPYYSPNLLYICTVSLNFGNM